MAEKPADTRASRIEALTALIRSAIDADRNLPVRHVLSALKAGFTDVKTASAFPPVTEAVRAARAADPAFSLDDAMSGLRGALDAVERRHGAATTAEPRWIDGKTSAKLPKPRADINR